MTIALYSLAAVCPLLWTMPDRCLAALGGVSKATITRWRTVAGVPPYRLAATTGTGWAPRNSSVNAHGRPHAPIFAVPTGIPYWVGEGSRTDQSKAQAHVRWLPPIRWDCLTS